ncbi:Glucose--fructose oxidoreductase [bacterium HR40]|nr:Glucose--fructose oxidoreductase [bacterium HR40]
MKREIGVGLVGSGFMGRSHALALAIAAVAFDLPLRPRLELLADRDPATARRAAEAFGFRRSTGDWRELVADPGVELVSITTPNVLHEPIAMAAIAAGKAVWCEKPLAPTAASAMAMAKAAEAAGVPTFVGFNYLKNPLVRTAREIVAAGELGEVTRFRGIHAEDYMADPEVPWSWRLDPANGGGAVADLGSHIIAMARFLVGPIEELVADLRTLVPERPVAPGSGERRKVEVDDEARALVRFANGATGTLEANWAATGRKMHLAFEVTGTRGAIVLNMERMNEMRLFLRDGRAGRQGFVEIPAGPAHPDYAAFVPAPQHQLGFNEIKAIEAAHILRALAGGEPFYPDFREAAEVQRTIAAIQLSARERRWARVDEVGAG